MPFGLSFKYFGSYCSALNRSTFTESQASSLTRIVIHTFWQHTELPKSHSVRIVTLFEGALIHVLKPNPQINLE
jgi:hypothetical protein